MKREEPACRRAHETTNAGMTIQVCGFTLLRTAVADFLRTLGPIDSRCKTTDHLAREEGQQ